MTVAQTLSGDLWGAVFAIVAVLITFVVGVRKFPGLEFYAYVASTMACICISAVSMLDSPISIEVLRTDTFDFYVAAQQYYENPEFAQPVAVGPAAYAYFLSWAFYFFGPSPFLTNNMGIIAFVLAGLVIAKVHEEVNGSSASKTVLLLFFLSPSAMFYTSLTWREPYQTLFFALAVLHAARYVKSQSIGSLGISFAFLMVGSLIHNKIILFNFAFVIWAYVIALFAGALRTSPSNRGQRFANLMIGPALIAGAFIVTYLVALTDTGAVARVMSGADAQEALQDWRATHDGRTKFLWDMDFSSPLSVLTTFPLVLLQFLAAPLIPLKPDSALDAVAAFDGLVRVALLWCAYLRLRRTSGQTRMVLGFLFGAYLLYSILLAAGTGNAGSALRHQVKVTWMLVIIGGPLFMAGVFGQSRQTRRGVR